MTAVNTGKYVAFLSVGIVSNLQIVPFGIDTL